MAATGKRHIFLTGSKGIGKSTLWNILVGDMPCIRTHAVPKQAVYAEDICIGVYDETLPGKDRKMRPVEEGFVQAAQLLHGLQECESDWVAMDEIGYLEPGWYLEKLQDLMAEKRLLAAVRKNHPILNREDALVVDLDGHNIGCVIMASGVGRRFGSNKLLAPLKGKPLASYAVETAKAVFDRVVVVTRYEEVARLHENTVLHDLPHRSDTVRLGVQALPDKDGWLFLLADQPFVTVESLQAMVLAAKNCPAIWRLGGGSPVLFPKWAKEELCALPQGKGGNLLMKQYGTMHLACEEKEQVDIDTKEDYERFCANVSP